MSRAMGWMMALAWSSSSWSCLAWSSCSASVCRSGSPETRRMAISTVIYSSTRPSTRAVWSTRGAVLREAPRSALPPAAAMSPGIEIGVAVTLRWARSALACFLVARWGGFLRGRCAVQYWKGALTSSPQVRQCPGVGLRSSEASRLAPTWTSPSGIGGLLSVDDVGGDDQLRGVGPGELGVTVGAELLGHPVGVLDGYEDHLVTGRVGH